MSTPFKSSSVTAEGQPDGFVPPTGFRAEAAPDGTTRLAISASPDRIAELHRALIAALDGPLGVLYVQLTDRARGVTHPKPKRYLALELPKDKVLDVFDRCRKLLYGDGRHQLWLRGRLREQLILDELGVIWTYPDDFSFRDVLQAHGVPELGKAQSMAERDYVRVEFLAEADAEEGVLMKELGLQEMGG